MSWEQYKDITQEIHITQPSTPQIEASIKYADKSFLFLVTVDGEEKIHFSCTTLKGEIRDWLREIDGITPETTEQIVSTFNRVEALAKKAMERHRAQLDQGVIDE